MNIGQAAGASGLRRKTLRCCEQIGLVVAARQGTSHRDYDEEEVPELRIVQRARSLDFSIDDCRNPPSLFETKNRANAEVKRLVRLRLIEIDRRIEEWRSMRAAIAKLMESRLGNDRPDCPILDRRVESIAGRHY